MENLAWLLLLLTAGSVSCIQYRECCPNGTTILYGGKHCSDNSTTYLGDLCNSMTYEPNITLRDGDVWDEYGFNASSEFSCVGKLERDPIHDVLLLCVFDEVSEFTYTKTSILAMISSVFLLITVFVYLWLPQLRSLQSWCLACLCSSQAVAFLILGLLQMNAIPYNICHLFGYTLYYAFMSTFFWTNVVSINLFLRVSDPPFMKRFKNRSKHVFIGYCIYAWSAALILLIATIISDNVEGDHLKPSIGKYNCWITGYLETWAFFYGPMAFIIAVNLALFILTSVRLWRTAQTYHGSALVILRKRFMLCLRLFLVMGVSWIFEIASFSHGQPHIAWEIADVINSLLGLWFFILMVLRGPVLRALAAKGFFCTAGQWLFPSKNTQDVEDILPDEEEEVNGIQMNRFNKENPI